tara:strand:+ start:992 stop:2119 length:1128 start_codon:yes stop_codon:yes gene_type:complete
MIKKIIALSLFASLSMSVSANIDTFADSFSSTQSQSWDTVRNGFVVKGGLLTSEGYGIQILSGDYTPTSHYTVSMVVDSNGGNGNQPMIFGFKDVDSPFYSFRLKTGAWGKWSVYKHEHQSHSGNQILAQQDTPYDSSVSHTLSVTMKNHDMFLSVDGEKVQQFVYIMDADSNKVGIYGLMPDVATVDNFIVTSQDTYNEDFQINLPSTFDYSNWQSFDEGNGEMDGLVAYDWGSAISNDSFPLGSKYTASMTWSKPSGNDGAISQGLIFNYAASDKPYYSVVMKQGELGRVTVYKHNDLTDAGGTLDVTSPEISYNSNQDHKFEVRVNGTSAKVYVNGKYTLGFEIDSVAESPKVGVQVRVVDNSIIKEFTIKR